MAELTNLTDRISHLRDRKGSSPIVQGGGSASQNTPTPRKGASERRFANDYFMVFVYALLAVAMLTQLILIVWLNIV